MRPFSLAIIPQYKTIMSEFSPFGMYVEKYKLSKGNQKSHSWYIFNDKGSFLYRYYNQSSTSGKLKTSKKQDLGKISPITIFSDNLQIDLNLINQSSYNEYKASLKLYSNQFDYYTFTISTNQQTPISYSWRYYGEKKQWLLVKGGSSCQKVLAVFQLDDPSSQSIGDLGFLTKLGVDELQMFLISLGLILNRHFKHLAKV
jgi:hypothetical protein